MSIRSIDTQIMIQRTMDTVRDASVLQRHPTTQQEQTAAKNIVDSARNMESVQELTEAEMQEIRPDVEADGGGLGGGGGSGTEDEETEEEEDLPAVVADYNRYIDIVV